MVCLSGRSMAKTIFLAYEAYLSRSQSSCIRGEQSATMAAHNALRVTPGLGPSGLSWLAPPSSRPTSSCEKLGMCRKLSSGKCATKRCAALRARDARLASSSLVRPVRIRLSVSSRLMCCPAPPGGFLVGLESTFRRSVFEELLSNTSRQQEFAFAHTESPYLH